MPPAPGEQWAEGDDKRTGEADEGHEGEVGDALGGRGGGGDEGLFDEEKGDDPLQIGDTEEDLAGLRAEEEREGEPRAERGRERESRGKRAGNNCEPEGEGRDVVKGRPPCGVEQARGGPRDQARQRVEVTHVGLEEGAEPQEVVLREKNGAVFGVELGDEEGVGFAEEEENREDGEDGGRQRGETEAETETETERRREGESGRREERGGAEDENQDG